MVKGSVRAGFRRASQAVKNAFTEKRHSYRKNRDVTHLRGWVKKTAAVLAISAALMGGRTVIKNENQRIRVEAKQFLQLTRKNPDVAIRSVYPGLTASQLEPIKKLAEKSKKPLVMVLNAMELAGVRNYEYNRLAFAQGETLNKFKRLQAEAVAMRFDASKATDARREYKLTEEAKRLELKAKYFESLAGTFDSITLELRDTPSFRETVNAIHSSPRTGIPVWTADERNFEKRRK